MAQERIELRKAFFMNAETINHTVAFFAPKRNPQVGESQETMLPVTGCSGSCSGGCGDGCAAVCSGGQ